MLQTFYYMSILNKNLKICFTNTYFQLVSPACTGHCYNQRILSESHVGVTDPGVLFQFPTDFKDEVNVYPESLSFLPLFYSCFFHIYALFVVFIKALVFSSTD